MQRENENPHVDIERSDAHDVDKINKLRGNALASWLYLGFRYDCDLAPTIQHYTDRVALQAAFDAAIELCKDDIRMAEEEVAEAEERLEYMQAGLEWFRKIRMLRVIK